MIQLDRADINARTRNTLRKRQERVDQAADQSAAAIASWKTFRGAARKEVVRALKFMCSGIERCMYCEDSYGTAIEHFQPKSTYPEKSFQWSNYLWACAYCNSNMKRDQFPMDAASKPLLIDPTSIDPFAHLALSLTTGEYVGLNDMGAASIAVFGLNREVCIRGRRAAWTCLQALVLDFVVSDIPGKQAILTTLGDFPFQGVRRWLSVVLESGDRAQVVPQKVRAAVNEFPELLA